MIKEDKEILREMKQCAEVRCEKFADISTRTALTPVGDEQYNQAIKDKDTLSRLIAHFEAVEKAEVPKKWDYSNNYSPEDFAYGAGYNACHDLFMPAYEKLMMRVGELEETVKYWKERVVIEGEAGECVGEIIGREKLEQQNSALKQQVKDLEAEVKRLTALIQHQKEG